MNSHTTWATCDFVEICQIQHNHLLQSHPGSRLLLNLFKLLHHLSEAKVASKQAVDLYGPGTD